MSLEEARKNGYKELFEKFKKACEDLRVDMGARHYIASLQSLLENFTWCVPSSAYNTDADISLYDHAVTTAAIAQALAVYHAEEGVKPGEKPKEAEKFILMGGDLSGIQSYIFDLEKSHGSGVAKLFRARSFYLQMLTKSVILQLLDELGLLPQAQVMDAGGRFVLLLPATRRVREFLPDFETRVQKWFYERFTGRIALNLTYDTALTEADMGLQAFQDKLDELNDNLEAAKLRKFDKLFSSGGFAVHDLDYGSYGEGACAVCSINPVDEEASNRFEQRHEREIQLCRECWQQIDVIGRQLPNRSFIVIERDAKPDNSVELFGGLFLRLEEKIGSSDKQALAIYNMRDRSSFAHHAVAGHLPLVSDEDLERWRSQGLVQEDDDGGFSWDGEAVEVEQPKTLNMLAAEARIPEKKGDEDYGFRGKPFLAAFKADVDNLGLVFSTGLGKKISISRFTSLSRMINHFFSDYMVRTIRDEHPSIYVVFAGGDDLFLIGPWTDMVAFADRINTDFRRYTAGNSDITLSAGIGVCRAKLPVHRMADHAEDLLDRSKEYKKDGGLKNAVTLFDVTTGWTGFKDLVSTGEWLEGLVLENKITHGLVNRLIYYAKEHQATMEGDVRRGIYCSHMHYDFKRNIDVNKLDEESLDRMHGLRCDKGKLSMVKLPASYALYRIRTE
jgi:CRISPR-associated protein Csm1